jgi:hypothetical protein
MLILFSFPLTTLADQNNELPPQKEGTTNEFNNFENCKFTINDLKVYNSESGFFVGTIAGATLGGLTSIALVSISGKRNDLSAPGISSGLYTIGKMFGGGMAMGIFASGVAPIVVMESSLWFLNYILNSNHFPF